MGCRRRLSQQALGDLDAALALEPTHISHYQLTLEPGTVFYHRPPPLPDSDAIWQMQLDCQERLAARGYEHYEVSAYARAGRRSRHNLNYWQFGDYIGIGAGAHGKLTWLASAERAQPAIVRSARVKQPREFLRRSAAERISDRFEVAAADVPFEYMLNVLRLTDDFAEADFEARTGLPFATLARRHRRSAAQTPRAEGWSRAMESERAGPAILERPAGPVPAGARGRGDPAASRGRSVGTTAV